MKVLYVTTISNTVNAFLIPHIKMLIEEGHEVHCAFNIVEEVNEELNNLGCKIHNIEFQRSPLRKENIKAYKKLKKLIQQEKYDLVHTHTPVASACVRLACKKLRNIKVLYTAHGFHFYKGAPLKNWLIFYPIERILARYTDVIITINNEDYKRAKNFKTKKVEYIPSIGLDTNKFKKDDSNRHYLRKKFGLPEEAFIVLSVGELNKNKNHETIIKAISMLKNPNIYYLICGQGPLQEYLKELSLELGIGNKVILLGYQKNIADIYRMADVFAFPSKREGLGMAALEAMASGLPIITSNVHGIVDYSIDGKTGYTCNPTDVEAFADNIEKLLKNSLLRKKMGEYNILKASNFNIESSLKKIKTIYGI